MQKLWLHPDLLDQNLYLKMPCERLLLISLTHILSSLGWLLFMVMECKLLEPSLFVSPDPLSSLQNHQYFDMTHRMVNLNFPLKHKYLTFCCFGFSMSLFQQI